MWISFQTTCLPVGSHAENGPEVGAGHLAVLRDEVTLLNLPQHLVPQVGEPGALHPYDLLDALDAAVQAWAVTPGSRSPGVSTSSSTLELAPR